MDSDRHDGGEVRVRIHCNGAEPQPEVLTFSYFERGLSKAFKLVEELFQSKRIWVTP